MGCGCGGGMMPDEQDHIDEMSSLGAMLAKALRGLPVGDGAGIGCTCTCGKKGKKVDKEPDAKDSMEMDEGEI